MTTILEFCQHLPEQTFAPGDTLLAEGGTDKTLFVLVDGTVEILKGDIPVAVLSQPGSMFGEIAVLLDSAHIATVRATHTTRVRVASDGPALLSTHPGLALEVARMIANRLQLVTGYVADLKQQFNEHDDHLCMVGEVVESLLNTPLHDPALTPGSDREQDPY